jgi:YggT family protein
VFVVLSFIPIIRLISDILTIVVIADIFVGYFLDTYHPVRRTLDSIVEPMLVPIKRYVPPVGMIDLSPLVLVLIIQFIEFVVVNLIISLV